MSQVEDTLCPSCQIPMEPQLSGDADDESFVVQGNTTMECPSCGYVRVPGELTNTVSYHVSAEDPADKAVAHFLLIRRLGAGSFGSVWLAEDTHLNRQVALKLPIAREFDGMNLLHEAKTAAHLQHPHIVRVYEVGEDHGQVFIASEYIRGLTLRDFLSQGKPKLSQTVDILVTICDALQHAHQQGVIHRDVKPANILLDEQGQPFVADFGIAKRISAKDTISSEGRIIGTARYMSPEQAEGKTAETDPRSDVYAIGVMLFEMLTGDVPFRGNLQALLHQKIHDDPPSPRTLDRTLHRDLETICLKCLEREPGKRYQTAREVSEELRRFRQGEPINARPISWPERGWRWCKRRPAIATLLLLLFVSLSSGLASVTYFYLRASHNAAMMTQAYYRSQMNLLSGFEIKGDYLGMRRILSQFAADTPRASLRGFEWHYYNHTLDLFEPMIVHGENIDQLALSHDGSLLATGSETSEVIVWDTQTAKRIRTLFKKPGRFLSMAFSPQEDVLVTGATDGSFRLWSPRTSDESIDERKHGPAIAFLQFAPNGQFFATAGINGAVRIWGFPSLELKQEIPTGQKSTTVAIRISSNSEQLAVSTKDGRITLWQIEGRVKSHVFPPTNSPNPEATALAFSDDGQHLAATTFGGAVRVLSLKDGEPLFTYGFDVGRIDAIEFLKGSPILAVAALDGKLHLVDIRTRTEIRKLPTHQLAAASLTCSADGRFLAVSSGDGTAKVLKVSPIVRPNIFWLSPPVRDVAFLPDNRLVAISLGGHMAIWDMTDGQPQILSEDREPPLSKLAVEPRGNFIVAAGFRSPQIGVWQADTGKFNSMIDVPAEGIEALEFSPASEELILATREGAILIYRAGEWETPTFESEKADLRVHAMAVHPAGHEIAVAFREGNVKRFNLANRQWLETPIELEEEVMVLAYCDAGHALALGDVRGEIHLWDLETASIRQTIKAHSNQINALTTLGENTLVSASRDRELKLWDIPSGELVTSLEHHLRQVFCVAVSEDHTQILSGGLEGDIRLWETGTSTQ